MKSLITSLILFGFLLSGFTFAQAPVSPPETFEEAQEMGEKALETAKRELPEILDKIWKEEVLPFWQKLWNWLKKTFWEPCIEPFLKEEVEKRKPVIEEEFEKEKEEAKEEAPKIGKSLWEKFKELIR
jgi:hypothetical protein